jgi:hypothetical protein
LGVVGLDGRMILKCILKRMGGEEAEWIQVIYFRDEWREVMDTVVNIWVPKWADTFLNSWATTVSAGRVSVHEFT